MEDHTRDDGPDPVAISPYPGPLIRGLEDLQHALEILIADQDLVFGVHVVEPAIIGGDGYDLFWSVRRLGLAKVVFYEFDLVGDLGS
jgi:hypothetical protein